MTTATEPRYLTCEWLDGPALVAWLRERGLENVKAFGTKVVANVTRWQKGSRAGVYSVDPLLVQLGLHLSQIPDDIWIDAPRTGQKISDETREELLERLGAGESMKRLAREFRISPSTVRYHRDRQRECEYKSP